MKETIIDRYHIVICTIEGCVHGNNCYEKQGNRTFFPKTLLREKQGHIERICRSFKKEGA